MTRLRTICQLLTCKHPYFSNLPLNAAWQVPVPALVQQALGNASIRVFDVGARHLSYSELATIAALVDYSAFDADESECARLEQAPRKHGKQRVLSAYVGDEGGEVEFHIYREAGCSSMFLPNVRFAEQFAQPDQVTVDRTYKLRSRSLDALINEHKLGYPHLLKLDTQGSELAILKAAPRTLAKCFMVELEAEFIEQYQGQPLFHDVCRFMYDNGFELYHINRMYKQRASVYSGLARGQLLFGDFLFVRHDQYWDGITSDDAAVFCVLLWCFGHIDAAYYMYKKRLINNAKYTVLRGLFENRNYNGLMNRIVQVIIGKADALVAAYLLLRKSNRLRSEQDRAWPIR